MTPKVGFLGSEFYRYRSSFFRGASPAVPSTVAHDCYRRVPGCLCGSDSLIHL